LQTADSAHQTIGKFIGLAVFSSDAMSSVAYAPQEMLIVLVAAGTAGFVYSIPLAVAIVILLAILTLSYEQTIHTYPNGGGAYIVSRDNLGEIPALVAAAALLTDYVLTVAVSISSGVAQVISAAPNLESYRVAIAVAMVILITVVNMRGVKESGSAFAIPSYFFVVMMVLTVGVGMFRYLVLGSLGQVVAPPQDLMHEVIQPISIFLILKAFSSGTTALTGVEAISNGITAFKEPRSKNAGATLIMMACILGTLMLGITFLSHQTGVLPSEEETVISQLARTVFNDRGFLYLAAITSTTVILMLAANTAFAGFPWLAALTAQDGYLPRQLTYRGSRLVYSRGIIALAGVAILLIMIFSANVTRLIPLYAIGVFLSFTLSQAGMAYRWYKSGKVKPGEEVQER
ncbi:amino acid permease, partial [bacterium]